MQVHDQGASKCPACKVGSLRTKEKQVIARDVEVILQRQDAADHLEVIEEEQGIINTIKDLNASIASAERRGNKDVQKLLERELANERKKLKKRRWRRPRK